MKSGTLFLAACLMAAPAASSLAQALPAAPPAPTAVPTTVAPDPQAVTLRYKFKAGETRRYRMTMDTDGTVVGGPGGQSMPLKQHMEMRMHQTVTQLAEDLSAMGGTDATIKIGIDSMTMTMNGRTMPLPANLLSQMKDLGTMVETTTGKVVSFTAGTGMQAGTIPGMDFSRMSGLQSSMSLPPNPVKPGDTWTNTVDLSKQFGIPGTSSSSAQFTLTSVDTSGGTPVANIHMTMSVGMDTSGAAATPGGMPMMSKITGGADLKFDVAAGIVTSQTGTTQIHMTMTPPNGQAPAGAGAFTINMNALTRLDLLPPDAPAPAPAPPDPALMPRTGEVRLEGTVRQTAPGQKRLVLLASRAQDPSGAAQAMDPPRSKVVLVRPTTSLRTAAGGHTTLSTLQPGDSVIVVGTSQGTGQPLVARIISVQ